MDERVDLNRLPMTWLVEKQDFGRIWWVVPARQDVDSIILHEIVPMKTNGNDRPDVALRIYGGNIITGMQSASTQFKWSEVQNLMDALWQAGVRPSRR